MRKWAYIFIKGFDKIVINVKASTRNYDILIEDGIFGKTGEIIKNFANGTKVFFVKFIPALPKTKFRAKIPLPRSAAVFAEI